MFYALAWQEVRASTIQKCFRHAGVLQSDLEVQVISDDDPFQEVDGTMKLSSLISQAMGDHDRCSVQEYVDGEPSVPICVELDDGWVEQLDKR